MSKLLLILIALIACTASFNLYAQTLTLTCPPAGQLMQTINNEKISGAIPRRLNGTVIDPLEAHGIALGKKIGPLTGIITSVNKNKFHNIECSYGHIGKSPAAINVYFTTKISMQCNLSEKVFADVVCTPVKQ